jgi:hypothetical protein
LEGQIYDLDCRPQGKAKVSKNAVKTGKYLEVRKSINYINESNTLMGYYENSETELGNKKY